MLIKQILEISFWSKDEDTANEAFDYVYEKWFKHDTDELEFVKFTYDYDIGVVANWKCIAYRRCECTPATRFEPEYVDYSNLIKEDEPKEWIEIFKRKNNLDEESIDEIYVYESIFDADDEVDDYEY